MVSLRQRFEGNTWCDLTPFKSRKAKDFVAASTEIAFIAMKEGVIGKSWILAYWAMWVEVLVSKNPEPNCQAVLGMFIVNYRYKGEVQSYRSQQEGASQMKA
jgi:hypothetical protein